MTFFKYDVLMSNTKGMTFNKCHVLARKTRGIKNAKRKLSVKN